MEKGINIEIGKNYLIRSTQDPIDIDYIKSLLPKKIRLVEDLKSILEIEEGKISKDTIILVSDFENLNLIEFDMVMKLANRKLKHMSIIGIYRKKALEHLTIEEFIYIDA